MRLYNQTNNLHIPEIVSSKI